MQPVNVGQYHLAQVNTAKMRYSLDAPEMADFVAQINSVNAVADDDPGFVWRLRGEGAEDATSIRVFDDESILITLTVWKSLEALSNYVYHGAHSDIMRSRRRWFEKVEQPILAMWWICAGYTPTVNEAKKRLEHLQQYGSTPYAFSFRKPFSPLDALEYEQLNLALA
ncbi:MAG: DUF3291 domain-containing protein [Calothrix sp. FI2-JRJ7]|jgi:heme-degrading monooxygenase HmoA|nr:DUF3291 domain-containing protein [Calothrix sp. FI2-JRJ7]